jgi:hypothetical protein
MAEFFGKLRHAQEMAGVVARLREGSSETSPQEPAESCIKNASPIWTILLYLISVATLRAHREEGSHESLQRLTMMKAALTEFGHRWRAEGDFYNHIDRTPTNFSKEHTWRSSRPGRFLCRDKRVERLTGRKPRIPTGIEYHSIALHDTNSACIMVTWTPSLFTTSQSAALEKNGI